MKRLLCTALLALSTAAAAQGALTIRFLDVGQGDAVLITSPEGKSLLYDGGRSGPRMKALIQQYQISTLQLIAASHADSDHITGLIEAAAELKPKFFLNNGLAGTTQTWHKLVATAAQVGAQGLVASGQILNLGSVKITVLPPPPGMKAGDQNLHSLGLLVQYGTFRALMTGDSETPETLAWLKLYPASFLGPIQVYKSIHHGAANGDTPAWLAAVRPANVVVSVGAHNTYGHPTAKALGLYKDAGANVFRTDQNGTVSVTVQANGQYRITPERGQSVVGQTVRAIPPVPPVPVPPMAPGLPAQAPAVSGVVYPNCAAVRAAGKAPLHVGDPGYSRKLDRDGDGIACE